MCIRDSFKRLAFIKSFPIQGLQESAAYSGGPEKGRYCRRTSGCRQTPTAHKERLFGFGGESKGRMTENRREIVVKPISIIFDIDA